MAERIVTMAATVRPARKNLQSFSALWRFEQGQGDTMRELDQYSNVIKDHRADIGSMCEKSHHEKALPPPSSHGTNLTSRFQSAAILRRSIS
jgi:hypothetical protein